MGLKRASSFCTYLIGILTWTPQPLSRSALNYFCHASNYLRHASNYLRLASHPIPVRYVQTREEAPRVALLGPKGGPKGSPFRSQGRPFSTDFKENMKNEKVFKTVRKRRSRGFIYTKMLRKILRMFLKTKKSENTYFSRGSRPFRRHQPP